MNVVMTGDGRFVEVQGTAEGAPFGREDLDGLLALAEHGHRGDPRAAAAAPARVRDLPRVAERAQGDSSSAGCSAPAWRRSPGYDAPVEDGATFTDNARIKARAGAAAAPAGGDGGGRRLRDRGRGARRRAGHPLRPLRRRLAWTTPAASRHLLARARRRRRPPGGVRLRAGGGAARRLRARGGGARGRARSRAAPRGAGGFGYDPVFVPVGETRTIGELIGRREGRAVAPGPRPRLRCAPSSRRDRRRPTARRRAGGGHERGADRGEGGAGAGDGLGGRAGRGDARRGRAAADDRGGVRGARRGAHHPARRRRPARLEGGIVVLAGVVSAFAALRDARRQRRPGAARRRRCCWRARCSPGSSRPGSQPSPRTPARPRWQPTRAACARARRRRWWRPRRWRWCCSCTHELPDAVGGLVISAVVVRIGIELVQAALPGNQPVGPRELAEITAALASGPPEVVGYGRIAARTAAGVRRIDIDVTLRADVDGAPHGRGRRGGSDRRLTQDPWETSGRPSTQTCQTLPQSHCAESSARAVGWICANRS